LEAAGIDPAVGVETLSEVLGAMLNGGCGLLHLELMLPVGQQPDEIPRACAGDPLKEPLE